MSLDARFKRLAMEEDDEDCGGDGSHGHSHAAAGQHGHSHGGGHGHSHAGAPCHGHSHSGSSHGHSHGGGGHGHGHSHGPGQMCYGHHGDEEEDEEELMMQAAAQNYIVSNKFDDKAKYAIDFDAASGRIEMDGVAYEEYRDERQMPLIMDLITRDLSEPYSIYTYRYFIHNWPYLCFLAMDDQKCVGSIVCKLDRYKETMRGYIAMLAVHQDYRRKKIGSNLVSLAIKRMIQHDADEVVLETEITNKSALKLYENLGFVKDKRLFRYYLNGVEAFRLKLWLK